MRPEVKYGILAGVVVLLVGSIGYVVYQSSRTDKPPDVGWLKDRGAASTEPNKVATPGSPTAAKPGPTPVTPGGRSSTPAPVRGPNTPIAGGPNTPGLTNPRPSTVTPPATSSPPAPVTPTTRPAVTPAPASTVLPPLTQPVTTRPAPTGGPITSPPAPTTPPSDANSPAPAPSGDPLRRSTGPVVPPPGPAAPAPGDSTLPKPPDSARPTTTTPPANAKSHKVAAGESLWVIAEHYYGDGNLWKKIKEANPSVDENRLFEGQSLVIPPKEGAASPAPTAKPDAKPRSGADPNRPALDPNKPKTDPNKPALDPNKPKSDPNKPKARKATYRVETGDTLVSIARAILKDGDRWREIYELNKDRVSNPDRLLVGTELRLPE